MQTNRQATLDYMANLISTSELLEQDEKLYWLDILKTLNQDNILRLVKILTCEDKKTLKQFNETYMINFEENGKD
jgi:hypothetical protein